MVNKKKQVSMTIVGIVLLIGIDQITKFFATEFLKGSNGFNIIPNVLKLFYLENFGAAFGILQNAKIFFVIITVLLLGFFVFLFIKLPDDKKYNHLRVVLTFFISGAIGNLIDRLVHTYVTDFIYLELINFPVFNVADIYVTCSCVYLAYLILFYYKDEDFNFLKKGN
ncbi:MAG: signal peptidase II [Lachnospiraceae bacterium]|nr:signal peptidase II [Lachnospiraceae bacterium]